MRISRFVWITALFSFAVGSFCATSSDAASRGSLTTERAGGGEFTSVSGVYQVTFNLTMASALPPNSTVVCKAAIAPLLRDVQGFSQRTDQMETAASVAKITGGISTCVVEIPFAWSLSGGSTGALLSIEVDAVNTSGALPVVVRSSVQQGIAEPYPTSGGTSSLAFNLTF